MPAKSNFNTRRQQIVELLMDRAGGLTHDEICAELGLSKTPYSRALIVSLIQDGHVQYLWQVLKSGQRAMVFVSTANLPTLAELDQAGINPSDI